MEGEELSQAQDRHRRVSIASHFYSSCPIYCITHKERQRKKKDEQERRKRGRRRDPDEPTEGLVEQLEAEDNE